MQFQPLRLPVPHEPCATRWPGRRTAPAHWDGSKTDLILIRMACLYHFWGLRPSFICSVLTSSKRPHLDSSLVFSTALKVLQAKGSRHLRPSFGTHYSPVSKVGLVQFIVHCRCNTICSIRFNCIYTTHQVMYLGRQEDARDVCWVWFPQLFHPFFCGRQCIFPGRHLTRRLWWKECQIKREPLNFPLFSHPLTCFIPIKRCFSQ